MPKQLVINRSKWLTGAYTKAEEPIKKSRKLNNESFMHLTESCLMREDNDMMCCLGFYALDKGAAIVDIVGESDLSELTFSLGTYDEDQDERTANPELVAKFEGLVDANGHNTDLSNQLIKANDDEDSTDAARENRIAELFATIGVEVIFEGQYTMPMEA